MEDLHNDKQLASRNFWARVPHPELKDSITYPGSYIKTTETDYSIRYRAPLIGEHNMEVYGSLGLSEVELKDLAKTGII